MAEIRNIAEEMEAAAPFEETGWVQRVPFADVGGWEGKSAPDRQWLLDHWIPHLQATYLTGPGAGGKSLMAQQLCTCVSLGLPFLGVPTKRVRAMYLTCEDDEDELHRRQEAICRALGVSMAALGGRLFLVSLAGKTGAELATFAAERRAVVDEFGAQEPIIRPTPQFRAIEGRTIANEIGFAALDNVAHLFAGNENIRVEVAAFVALMNQLAHRISGSVLLIGHPNKAGDSFSGSTAWENQVRSRLFLEKAKTGDGEIIDHDLRVLRREKANYAPNNEELRFRWHEWAYVLESDLPDDLRERLQDTAQATNDNAIFLACLAERNRQDRPVSENTGPNYAPAMFAKMPESKGIGKQRLSDAMDRLFRLNQIEHATLGRDTRAGRNKHGLRAVE